MNLTVRYVDVMCSFLGDREPTDGFQSSTGPSALLGASLKNICDKFTCITCFICPI